jgi:hypothetical protein
MKRETVYETAAETAKKIRGTLKQAFPGVKFSVRSETYSMGSSVYASWTDGPIAKDVDNILDRFKSGSFDGMNDMYVSTGYEWEGQIFNGAKYVSSSRTLSSERKQLIHSKLVELDYVPEYGGGFLVRHYNEAELMLIEEGVLKGYPSQLPEVLATVEQEAVPVPNQMERIVLDPVSEGLAAEKPKLAKVFEFPIKAVRDPALLAELTIENYIRALTPEQKLKLQLLKTVLGDEEVKQFLLSGKVTVDDMFRIAAERVFN